MSMDNPLFIWDFAPLFQKVDKLVFYHKKIYIIIVANLDEQ
jgi:hypothetical protein